MCVVDRDIPLMSQLDIGLLLPAQKTGAKPKTLRIKGVVVRKENDARTGRFLIAVYFSGISAADQKRLEQFIARYLKTP